MRKITGLLIVLSLLAGLSAAELKTGSWTDNFDELSPLRWSEIPSIAQIVPKDTLSAANRVMLLSPENGQQYLLSSEKFVRGDIEFSFCAKRPKSGNLFYYIGFHATEPWTKSVCWLLIHNEVINFSVKTVSGKRLHIKIGEVKENFYHRVKISQSSGKLSIELDGKVRTFDDPELISTEPMSAFIGANTPNGASVPAELRVDYMKVIGGTTPPRLTARQLTAGEKSIAAQNGGNLLLNSGKNSFSWDINSGFRWQEIRQDGKLLNNPAVFAPVFAALINDKYFYSHELEVIRTVQKNDSIEVFLKENKSGMIFMFRAVKEGDGNVKLFLEAVNRGSGKPRVQLIFPLTASLVAPGAENETEYFFPWRGGVKGRVTADFSAEYGGLAWMQLCFAANPVKRTGLMIYPLDTTGRFKGLRMLRQQDGITLVRHMEVVTRDEYPTIDLLEKQSGLVFGQYYRSKVLAPSEKIASCEVLMATFDGSWKTPLAEYSKYMRAALKPVEKPRWFRDTFTWVCGHPQFYYNQNAGKYVMSEQLAGGENAAQLAFWDDYVENPRAMSQLERVQPGDFIVHKGRGGEKAFRAEIDRVKAKDTRMTLYIDYRFCWRGTATAAEYGKAWGVKNRLGNYAGYINSEDLYLMCFYDQDKWAKYIADTCGRLVKNLNLDGIYLDELGISFPCYHPGHDHVKKGEFPVAPQELAKSITMVRNAMRRSNPQAALMTEHAASDYLTQFYDGSWDQTFIRRFDFTEKYYDDLRLCIFRFYFPDFKLSEWGASTYHAKRNLFNGMAMDMGGAPDKDEQRLYAQLMKENGDAFGGLDVEPIIPSTADKLLANRFRAAGKVCYTFYNTSGREITGGIVEDPGMGDCRLVELIRDEEVDSPQAVRVPTGAVAVLGCFRKLLNVKRADGALTISVPAGSGDKVIICENRDDCHFHQPRSKRVELPLENGSCRYTLRGNGKVIIKLMKDGYQVDQVVIK